MSYSIPPSKGVSRWSIASVTVTAVYILLFFVVTVVTLGIYDSPPKGLEVLVVGIALAAMFLFMLLLTLLSSILSYAFGAKALASNRKTNARAERNVVRISMLIQTICVALFVAVCLRAWYRGHLAQQKIDAQHESVERPIREAKDRTRTVLKKLDDYAIRHGDRLPRTLDLIGVDPKDYAYYGAGLPSFARIVYGRSGHGQKILILMSSEYLQPHKVVVGYVYDYGSPDAVALDETQLSRFVQDDREARETLGLPQH